MPFLIPYHIAHVTHEAELLGQLIILTISRSTPTTTTTTTEKKKEEKGDVGYKGCYLPNKMFQLNVIEIK